MKRSITRSVHQSVRCKSSRSEDHEVSRSRSDEEKMLRRHEWKLEQRRQRQHERLKQKKIYEYEMQRAREKGLPPPKPPNDNRSKSRSKSPRSRPARPCISTSTNTSTLCERLESVNGTVPLFKGPEGTKISAADLRRIKVDIYRNIPGKSTDSNLQRDIINPEDVVVKRRAGSKPIFEREEIKGVNTKVEEVEEHRTVVTVNNESLEGKLTLNKRSTSLSPIRNRNHSPRRTLSRHSRHKDLKDGDRKTYRDDKERYRDRNGSKDSYKEKERRRTESHIGEEERDRKSRGRSRSRDREERKWDRDSHHRNERSYREYRERSRERSRDRRDRDRSREQRVPPPHYIGQIPVPIYYSHFSPRPIMMAPIVPIRGQVPLGNSRHPPIMGPLRPFAPRFIPPDIHRLRVYPPNPRFGPMF